MLQSLQLLSMGLILEHFLKFLLKCFLRTSEDQRKTNVRKGLRLIHERLKMCSYAAKVFSAVLHRMRILKLKVRSRAPGFAYIHAVPAPYKGMQLKRHVHNPQTPQQRESNFRLIKIMSKQKASTSGLNADLTSPVQRWR